MVCVSKLYWKTCYDADLNERMEDERPNHTMIGSLMDDERKGLSHKNNNCLKVPKCEILDRSDFH